MPLRLQKGLKEKVPRKSKNPVRKNQKMKMIFLMRKISLLGKKGKKKCGNNALSSIENRPISQTKKTVPRKGKSELKSDAVGSRTPIQTGSWVLVSYNYDEYPGLVTNHDDSDDDFEVKTLRKIQYRRETFWKWPEKEDKIYYTRENIVECLPNPQVSSGTGRGAGLYSFQTLKDY